MKKFLPVLFILLMFSLSFAQLTGTKTIPGDYTTIQAAIAALNSSGVGSGGVTFNVAAGHTESSTDSLVINATGTSGNPIVFQKSGTGANPVISRTDGGFLTTSSLGGAGDAVIKFNGTDYITFDGIDVSGASGIEYGYLTHKNNGTDACQNLTIKNATITMTKGTSAFVMGIYVGNGTTSLSSATGVTVTDQGGRNINIVLTGNTVQNVHAGIYVRGSSATGFADSSVIVGQSGAGNIIKNFGGGSATATYGVYFIYVINPNVAYNTINNADGGSAHGSTLYGVFTSSGVAGDINCSNNNITMANSSASSATYYIYNTNAVTSETYNNNTFAAGTLSSTGSVGLIWSSTSLSAATKTISGNSISGTINRTGASGTFYFYYNNGSGTHTENLYNNTISNITLTGSSTFYGFLSTTASTCTHNIYNNTVKDITGGTGTMYGIHRTLAAGSVYNNSVYNLTGGGTIWGISCGSGNMSIYKNSIYNLSSSSIGTTAGTVTGIYVSAQTNTYIYNNFVSELKAPTCAATDAIRGIGSIAASTTANLGIYYNTIFLNASSTGTNFGTSGIYVTTSTTATSGALDMRNNIIVNASTSAGTGFTAAYRRSSTTLTNFVAANNNLFFAGTPSATNLIYYDGTNSDQTIAGYKARVSPLEAASFSENATFVNSTTPPYDLHINTTAPTQIESGAGVISAPISITDDFDGQTRNATTPDVGADEFNGVGLDLTPPTMTYTALMNTSSLTARNLAVTVTDPSGVPTTSPGWPNLYWKINSAASYTAATPNSVVGSVYTFNFGAGVVLGDTVKYYICAQDNAGTPNVGASPSVGASGFSTNPPAASTPPTTPNSYIIIGAISGIKTVGISGDYATLTAAINDFNAKEQTGPVTFSLLDADYSTSETFPIVINQNPGTTSTNTLTIKPASSVNATISGAASAIIKLNGADYVTIDGSNSGTSSRNLTISNSGTAPPIAAIWIGSLGIGAGAMNNTIKNCNINNGLNTGTTYTSYAIFVGSASTIGTAGENNNNLTIQNNIISKAYHGIYAVAPSTGINSGLNISSNIIGSNTATDYIGYYGVYVEGANPPLISQNEIFNIISAVSINIAGINIGQNVTGASINRNLIHDIKQNATGGWGAYGINIASGTNVSNIVISNNMIYGINTINYSTSSTIYNPFGIRITGGTGHKLYYNSVHLYGSQFASGTVGTLSAALLIISSTATGMDIRDNIFSNGIEGLAGSSSYAVYGVTGVTFGTINFNDYYGFGTYGKLGFLGSEKLTLADWQAATLQDSNSVAGDPKFVSDTDLHILTTATSPVNNAGTPIAGITEDFDGNTRSLTTPDIGADEYTYIPPSVVDPTGVSATAINATQINIAFTANVNNDSVIVVWNNTGTFTTPTGAPPAVGDSLAGGKLLYNGTVSPQSHAGLTPITQYYYKLFSYNGTSYSPGVTATATTPCPVYTLPFSESVNGATFPSCWSQTSTLTGTRWTVSATNNAGGTANEFKGTYVNGTGLTRLITPALNTTGVTALTVNFKHFFDDYAAGINYKVQSSVDGVTWTDETWGGASGGGNVGPADVSFDVTNNLGTTTYIAWVLDGNHFQFDYWYLDNIEIIKKPAIDLALTQLYQFTGLPTPRINEHFTDYTVSLSNKTSKNGEDIATLAAGLSGTKASDANLTGTIVDSKNSLLNNLLSNITVKAQISNLGLNAATYNLNWDVDGVSQTPYNGPSVSPAGKDTAVLTFTPTVRGTFFTNGAIVVTGDEVAGNNSKQFRMRVYPDVFSRKIYDRGDNTVDTYVGWGDTTKPMKAGVRFTADSTVRLAGVDFIYRTETVSTGNFSVQVRAAGGTTTAPGAVLYEKHFNTPVYFPTGNTGAYIHFAFDSNAPIITAGSDYWITIKAPLGIQYPGAVQNTGFTAGRSFYEGNPDTTTWTPLVITTERAWIMRSVTIPYSAPELSGDYIIPKGANPKGFPSLAAAIDSLNKAGLTGTVRFLIDANLNETGANVRIYRPDLSAANNLIIKPNTGKTPTVTFTGCSTSGEAAYSGFTIDSSGFITIDGSNTASGTSRDMTFAMADSVNGRIVIQLYENTDNITIKNLNISYTATPASSTSSRGIYANGLIGGVADSVIIQNCKIGDGIQNPNYAVSITGYSTGTLYASKIYIRNNLLYGRMRTVYFYYGGKTGTTSEISGNELITNIAPPDANVLWGILFNTYGGTFNIFNNKIQTLKMASTGTQGIYGFGTLTGQTGTVLNIYNNFIGGDVDHTGTGATASIDMISFQDLATGTANIYHNTIVLNSLTKTATGRMTAIRLAGTWNKYVKNNIFVNNKSGSAIAYCILMGDTTGIIDFNNNAYYVADTANANIGYWKSANKTLTNWQAASQQDALSFVENPVFTSSTNFHIPNGTTTFLESGGTPIAWITTDIDGQARNSTTPDIGADEFAGIRPGVVVPDTATFTLSRLWNIIAVPLTAENMSKTSLFPTATSNAFWYQPGSGYVTQDTLAMGKGYWLKFDSAKTHTILGTTSTSKTFDVSTGWNLIGGLNANVPTTNVTTNPPGLVSSSFFGYSGAYYASTVLDRGRGYWVKTSGAGTMTVSLTTAKDAPEQDMFVETIEPSWKVINIADAFGREMNLYMANKVDENKFELPPVPPIGIFDARFQTQRYVESDGIAQRIDLNSAVYPVSITLRNSEKGFYRIKDAYNGSLLNIVVKDGQPITITNPAISSITIEGTTVPTQFQLMQNYPNPFNPTTLIRYALAEQVEVKLVVYNAVGERVKVLVQNEQEPGYYAVELNGADLASGIYFVRLETPKFTKTIKAMLLK